MVKNEISFFDDDVINFFIFSFLFLHHYHYTTIGQMNNDRDFRVNAELTSYNPNGKKEYRRYIVKFRDLAPLIQMLASDNGVKTIYINKPFLSSKQKNVIHWKPSTSQ